MSVSATAELIDNFVNESCVRMSDVQPIFSKDHIINNIKLEDTLDTVDYVGNDDSNIGCMVSIKSDDVECTEISETEYIIPEVIVPTDDCDTDSSNIQYKEAIKRSHCESWPTLEILPGGVIKLGDKDNNKLQLKTHEDSRNNIGYAFLYSCAKCSQNFNYLSCLVKHVKWHETELNDTRVLDDHEYIRRSPNKRKVIFRGRRGYKIKKL